VLGLAGAVSIESHQPGLFCFSFLGVESLDFYLGQSQITSKIIEVYHYAKLVY
jgi:hypothetical protein